MKPGAISRNRANDLILLEATLMSRVSVPRPLMKRNTLLFTFAVQPGITFGDGLYCPTVITIFSLALGIRESEYSILPLQIKTKVHWNPCVNIAGVIRSLFQE